MFILPDHNNRNRDDPAYYAIFKTHNGLALWSYGQGNLLPD